MTCRVAVFSGRRDARAFRTSHLRCLQHRILKDQRKTPIALARVDDAIGDDDLDDDDDDDEFWEEFGEIVTDDAAVLDTDAQSGADELRQAPQLSKEELRMEMANPDNGASAMLPVIAGAGALLAAGVFFWRKRSGSATESDGLIQVCTLCTPLHRICLTIIHFPVRENSSCSFTHHWFRWQNNPRLLVSQESTVFFRMSPWLLHHPINTVDVK